MDLDLVSDPIGVVGHSSVHAREIRRRATNAPTRYADQHELPLLLVVAGIRLNDDQRTAAVTLATVDATGQISSAKHVSGHQAWNGRRLDRQIKLRQKKNRK